MNSDAFFKAIKPVFKNGVTVSQRKAISDILAIWDGAPIAHTAYALATVLAECGANMLPVREGFTKSDGAARAYVKKHYWTMKNGKAGYGRPTGPFQQVYYGRGYVQLTWLNNYQKAQDKLGINFVRDPDLALIPANAALIMRRGMEGGWFTSKKLSQYLDGPSPDYVNARRIINGADRAKEIAGYARRFERALIAADWGFTGTRLKEEDSKPPQVEEAETPVEATPVAEVAWWEKWPIIRQITNTFSALGIGASTVLGLDKTVIIALVFCIAAVSVFAIYTHSRKAK